MTGAPSGSYRATSGHHRLDLIGALLIVLASVGLMLA